MNRKPEDEVWHIANARSRNEFLSETQFGPMFAVGVDSAIPFGSKAEAQQFATQNVNVPHRIVRGKV